MSDPLEQIHAAFRDDDASLLRAILDSHPELKARVNDPVFPFDSPPITCVKSRPMLDVLLDAGADINARSLWWAGGFGLLDFAEPDLAAYAIQRGAVVYVHAAARLGMLDRLHDLISADPTLVHARGGDGQTPLHFASTVEIAAYLLDHNAQIDALDIDHESTPAQYMIRDRQPVAKYLVERGCATDILMAAALGDIKRVREHLHSDPQSIRLSVCTRDFPKRNPRAGGSIYIWTLGQNKSAYHIAREFGHKDVAALLLDHSPVELKLALAYEFGDDDVAKEIRAANPNIVLTLSDDDRRRLPHAAQDNNTDAVRRMLSAGWPVDARGRHNATPLHWAAFHGNAEMTEVILAHNPPLEDTNNDYNATPLGWATHGSEHGWHRKTGDYSVTVDLLCAAGAKIPATPQGSPPVIEVLRRYAKANHPAP